MSVSAIIVAAGESERLKAGEKKPFLKLRRRSILETAVCNFEKNTSIKNIIVVAHKDDLEKVKKLLRNFKKVRSIISGGKKRSHSVKKGISSLASQEKIVLIHDAARPFVSSALIERIIYETRKHSAVIPAIEVTSTVKKIKGNFVEKTIDRKNLFLAQTPQGFKVDVLKKAFDKKKKKSFNITDDAFLLEILGKKIKVITGEASNIKITTKDDLKLARRLIK